jgi:ABC-type dipeptide/oligopeptide/nickel transport system ATPase component
LQESQHLTILLVTHDLALAKVMADEVVVLRQGRIVEWAVATAFFSGPQQEYSRELLATTAQQALVRNAAEVSD